MTPNLSKPRAIVFDWDNTLVDSWPCIHTAMNATLAQIQKNASDAALARANIQFQAQQQVSDDIRQSYEKTQATVDQCNEAFDQTIRGVQEYQNPDGTSVELPLDYSHAWSNGNGDYVVTNDALYNPNSNRQGSWQQLTPKN